MRKSRRRRRMGKTRVSATRWKCERHHRIHQIERWRSSACLVATCATIINATAGRWECIHMIFKIRSTGSFTRTKRQGHDRFRVATIVFVTYEVNAFIRASRWCRFGDGVGKFGSLRHCWTQAKVQSIYNFDRVNRGKDNVSTKWRGLAPPTH